MPSFAAEIYSRKHDGDGHQSQHFAIDNKENNILFIDEDEEEDNQNIGSDDLSIGQQEEDPIIIDNSTTTTLRLATTTTNKDHQFKRGHDILKNRKWYTWIFPIIASILILWVVVGYLFGFLLSIILSSSETTFTRILHSFYFILFSFISSCIIYPFIKCTFTNPGFVFKEDKMWSLTTHQIKQFKKRGPRFIVDLEKEIKEIMSYRNEIRDLVDGSTSSLNQSNNHHQNNDNHSNDHHHQEELSFNDSQTSELNSRGQVRICEKCWIRKPDRAHHCRQLNCCVLRMDHYCPWFNNCIGYYNHKYFVTFLAWIAIAGFFIVGTMSKIMFKTLQQHGSQNSFSFLTFNNLWIYVLSFCFGFSMFFFAGYHFKLILFNTTTLESLDKERRLYEQHHCHPYDVGALRNIKSILGNNPLLWLSPFHVEYEGDGCHFPLLAHSNLYEPVVNSSSVL